MLFFITYEAGPLDDSLDRGQRLQMMRISKDIASLGEVINIIGQMLQGALVGCEPRQ